jgi:hypothetical protein
MTERERNGQGHRQALLRPPEVRCGLEALHEGRGPERQHRTDRGTYRQSPVRTALVKVEERSPKGGRLFCVSCLFHRLRPGSRSSGSAWRQVVVHQDSTSLGSEPPTWRAFGHDVELLVGDQRLLPRGFFELLRKDLVPLLPWTPSKAPRTPWPSISLLEPFGVGRMAVRIRSSCSFSGMYCTAVELHVLGPSSK